MNARGVTLVELTLTMTIAVALLAQISSVWISFSRQLQAVQDRAKLLREARAARAVLAGDWKRGVNASEGIASLTLELPADSKSTSVQGGVTHYSHTASYSLDGGKLVRYDNGATLLPQNPSALTAARDVETFDFDYVKAPLVTARLGLKRRDTRMSAQLMLVNCGSAQIRGRVDCRLLLPLFFYAAFSPIEQNVVYSSFTAMLGGNL